MDDQRTYGVEIEISDYMEGGVRSGELSPIVSALRNAGIPAAQASYSSGDQGRGGRWKVVHDSSCGPEIISPPLAGTSGLQEIAAVVKVLQELDARVTASCGLHVHHDASDLSRDDVARVTALYSANQEAISSLLPESRRPGGQGSSFCRPLPADTKNEVDLKRTYSHLQGKVRLCHNIFGSDRYMAVNWQAFDKHGTVEFRQHSGTLNARKIAYWVLLTQGIITAAKTRVSPVTWSGEPEGGDATSAEMKRLASLWLAVGPALGDDPNYKRLKRFYRDRMVRLAGGYLTYNTGKRRAADWLLRAAQVNT